MRTQKDQAELQNSQFVLYLLVMPTKKGVQVS